MSPSDDVMTDRCTSMGEVEREREREKENTLNQIEVYWLRIQICRCYCRCIGMLVILSPTLVSKEIKIRPLVKDTPKVFKDYTKAT